MNKDHSTHDFHGLAVDAALAGVIRHMPVVDATREALQGLQGVWDTLALLSEMSSTGVEIAGIRSAFAGLTAKLVNEIAGQARHKAALEQVAKAQVAIDILVRNLFERTADIGFLATDDDLRQFAQAAESDRPALAGPLRLRLREYQRKYSVYDDILLLAPDGRVLARLDESVDIAATRDRALLEAALAARQPYVEVYRHFDLRPAQPRSLVYACRVCDDRDASGGTPIGVLCLSFRFDDECQRIFRKFVGVNDWSVVALLDDAGRVLSSSDPFQVPPGAEVAARAEASAQVVRFAGRNWLAATCSAHAFQGYAGPGWRGHAMTPLDHAFGGAEGADADGDTATGPSAETLAALQGSRVLYPDTMRAIASRARGIEADLARAVWNGNLATSNTAGGSADAAAAGFSRSLLREIGRTGARTRDTFTQALDEMSRSVVAAKLADAALRAMLVSDIMDRSLYERANDCRWWALTTEFRRALESPHAVDRAALEQVLQAIHGLYTVYANLLLFDRHGRIVAVSRSDDAAAPGGQLDAEWVGRTLALRDTQAYAVSRFEPSALYGGRPTYIYAAAVRGLADPGRVVGGIAIVFDSEPQFRSMLEDTLPRDAQGQPLPDAFGAFLGPDGRVLACSHGAQAVGSLLALPQGSTSKAGARMVGLKGRWYTMGVAQSTGYREFKGAEDPYREEVTALVFEPITDAAADPVEISNTPGDAAAGRAGSAGAAAPPFANRRSAGPIDEPVDLATFMVDGQWHALPGRDLVEAMTAERLLPLPGSPAHVRGTVLFREKSIAVLDARALLGGGADRPAVGTGPIVVLRGPADRPVLGLMVDALGSHLVVSKGQLVRLPVGSCHRGPRGVALIDTVVAPPPGESGGELLTLLSGEALIGLVSG